MFSEKPSGLLLLSVLCWGGLMTTTAIAQSNQKIIQKMQPVLNQNAVGLPVQKEMNETGNWYSDNQAKAGTIDMSDNVSDSADMDEWHNNVVSDSADTDEWHNNVVSDSADTDEEVLFSDDLDASDMSDMTDSVRQKVKEAQIYMAQKSADVRQKLARSTQLEQQVRAARNTQTVQSAESDFKKSDLFVKGRNGGDDVGLLKSACDSLSVCPIGSNAGDVPEDMFSTHPKPIKHGKSVKGRHLSSPAFKNRADADIDSWANAYTHAKNEFTKATGLSYTIDVSAVGQRAAPNGHITPWQTQYYGAATWDMFQSDVWGSGSANIAYELVRYWNGNGAELGGNIGIVTPLNDYTEKANYFYELSYTHQLAGKWKWLSVTLGQFPMYNFDGTTYNSNQQINFINESFSQNATSLYPSAGLGGYVTISPNDFWSVSVGGQDASNIEGDRISSSHFGKKFTSFISGTINPSNRLGDATISVLLYNQPSVPEQPEKVQGWSINGQQNIGKKLAVFMRANGVNKGLSGIKQSYVLGGVYNNPLNRNALDQIGFAAAVNKLDKGINGAGSRSVENMLEAYWAWGISSVMTITPDIQFYINPGLNQKSNTATVASIRATLMF